MVRFHPRPPLLNLPLHHRNLLKNDAVIAVRFKRFRVQVMPSGKNICCRRCLWSSEAWVQRCASLGRTSSAKARMPSTSRSSTAVACSRSAPPPAPGAACRAAACRSPGRSPADTRGRHRANRVAPAQSSRGARRTQRCLVRPAEASARKASTRSFTNRMNPAVGWRSGSNSTNWPSRTDLLGSDGYAADPKSQTGRVFSLSYFAV